MNQVNNDLYRTSMKQNGKTKVCFLMTNAFTCRNSKRQNISALMKLANLKEQHKQYHLNLKTKINFNKQNKDNKQQKGTIEKTKQGYLISMSQRDVDTSASYQNYNENNDKIIQKIKTQQSDHSQTKKHNYSCLEKCRMATESYDQLKRQIINRIKINRSRKTQRCKMNNSNQKQKLILFDGVIQKDRNKQNEIVIRSESIQKHYVIRQNRYRSQSDSHKKAQRYTQISVADFMDEPQSNISGAISKKFEEFRKTFQRQSRTDKYQEKNKQCLKVLHQN